MEIHPGVAFLRILEEEAVCFTLIFIWDKDWLHVFSWIWS
jgi:hypothetical protein